MSWMDEVREFCQSFAMLAIGFWCLYVSWELRYIRRWLEEKSGEVQQPRRHRQETSSLEGRDEESTG